MNSSFLYHAWGLYTLECTREEYKGNTKTALPAAERHRLSSSSIIATQYMFCNGRHVSLVGEWEQWDVTVAVALVQSTLGTTCVDAVFVMVKE